jgi:hypothetical protein
MWYTFFTFLGEINTADIESWTVLSVSNFTVVKYYQAATFPDLCQHTQYSDCSGVTAGSWPAGRPPGPGPCNAAK